MPGALRLVLGDQLSPALASLEDADPDRDLILMAEVMEECTYVPHHPKKIAFVLSAMRHFAADLEAGGFRVRYVPLDDPGNTGSLEGEVERALRSFGADRIVLTEAGEWRVAEIMRRWQERFGCPVDIREDTRFLCSHADFAAWAKGRKSWRMEHFYREMRRRTGFLMSSDGKPEGGEWNYDAANRKALPDHIAVPDGIRCAPDAITEDVLDLVDARFGAHAGKLRPFAFAVTRQDAEAALDRFVEHLLPDFGNYQDAMARDEATLFHSVLSPYLNAGLLDPHAVCAAAERAYREGNAPLNAVEGFIRQILGWREYVRGLYWQTMPDYATRNTFNADRPLPAFFWSAETDMACLAESIGQTLDNAYAHHIQRLMVIGNFALLAGLDPREVCAWYLAVYADAYEWVELPNTLGMALFADNGQMASKPYAASGSYINRMSDYCAGCRYEVKEATGKNACPFNALYWDFIARNRERLDAVPRMGLVLKNWDRMEPAKKAALRRRAGAFLEALA